MSGDTQARNRVMAMKAMLVFKAFQVPIFESVAKTLVLHWSRQVGKSYVLAAWAVWRILTKALAGENWLVCVLSNSKDNGTEFMVKVRQVCDFVGLAMKAEDLSPDDHIENMRIECRITILGFEGRIKVLAANPRTARGFSGDLILDEFGFHEDSYAIWDAAEPILSANAGFQCRIASTGNGSFNMFYHMVAGAKEDASRENPAGLSISDAEFPVSRVSRSAAYELGQKIYDLKTGAETTPAQARAAALDKASYDQNYELAFNDEQTQLLTQEAISGCEYKEETPECIICDQTWSVEALTFLAKCGPLCFGQDVGRSRNLSSLSVGEKIGGIVFVRAILRMRDMRLPQQCEELVRLFRLPNMQSGEIDMTGIGLGLVEFAQEELGTYRVRGVNFCTREERNERQALIAAGSGLPVDSAKVTEIMALDILQAFENRAIRIPHEQALRDSLRKPKKAVVNNQVVIAAEDDDAGHADEFWSLALLIRAFRETVLGIQSRGDIRVGSHVLSGARGVNLRPTFTPRTLGDGIADAGRRFGTVPSTAVQMAVNAVQTGNLVRCRREEWSEVRKALWLHGETCLDKGNWIGKQNVDTEIERLDVVFEYKPMEAAAAV